MQKKLPWVWDADVISGVLDVVHSKSQVPSHFVGIPFTYTSTYKYIKCTTAKPALKDTSI